eukprot:scaffold25895_cov108-Cylindrotheca_fusiformis.AAC.5
MEDAFETVKQYLLECPHVPSTHPAIKAALEGIEREEKRQERDAKLQRKFAATQSNSTKTTTTTAAVNGGSNNYKNSTLSDSAVMVAGGSDDPQTRTRNSKSSEEANYNNRNVEEEEDDDDMEWQDIAKNKSEDEEEASEDDTSFLGKELAKLAIDSISKHNVKVSSPVAAIALVIHAALRSEVLQFACTGIPESSTSKKGNGGGGFAPPVRELTNQFLPNQWDQQEQPNCIQLRYRKNGTGAVVLKVAVSLEPQEEGGEATNENDQVVRVELGPANTQEPPSQSLTFPIKDHINLDSFLPALTKSSNQVPPALHYKFLPVLLTKFCRIYDLGSTAQPGETNTSSIPYVDNTISTSILHRPIASSSTMDKRANDPPYTVPTTLDQAFPAVAAVNDRYGDFAGDLAPAGLVDPLRIGGPRGRMGGNLMGPNHPQFMGGGPNGIGPGMMGGPGTMQPRFDPVLPPGIVDDGTNGRSTAARRNRQLGEPNPDHLPPPNSFGGDHMFM